MERNLNPYGYAAYPYLGARWATEDHRQEPKATKEDEKKRAAERNRTAPSSASSNKNGSKESSATLSYHG
ncbi:hypothetical protein PG993_014103 [Apiospora rasikravindrae]|uniref:Uncharacterized protein n=1 Tax=Apiospora rasikravindrae TaxID=990691 RepID=A0ABR1RSB8_9PEZI